MEPPTGSFSILLRSASLAWLWMPMSTQLWSSTIRNRVSWSLWKGILKKNTCFLLCPRILEHLWECLEFFSVYLFRLDRITTKKKVKKDINCVVGLLLKFHSAYREFVIPSLVTYFIPLTVTWKPFTAKRTPGSRFPFFRSTTLTPTKQAKRYFFFCRHIRQSREIRIILFLHKRVATFASILPVVWSSFLFHE